jgi:hypothetical protein
MRSDEHRSNLKRGFGMNNMKNPHDPNDMNDMNQQRQPGARWIPRWALFTGVILLIGIALLLIPPTGAGSWLAYLPFVLLLACPLMMIFMMGSMNHAHDSSASHVEAHGVTRDGYDRPLDLAGLSTDNQIWTLRQELTRMNWRQEELRQELERLEASCMSESPDTAGVRR